MEMAVLSGRGFTSLPTDAPTLEARLEISAASFGATRAPLECWYTLMLEDDATGEVAGVAGVKAGVGLKRPHFSFRVLTMAQSSPTLNLRFDHQALVLVNRGGATGGEVMTLAGAIQTSVYERFGIRLEPEPVVL